MNELLLNRAKKLGIHVPVIMLPNDKVDMTKWAVVACDQYTSQPEYWEQVKRFAGDEPSTLNLVFPEVFLEDEGKEQRIEKINATMKKYISEDILKPLEPCFIYVDRKTTHAASRKGLVIAVDLEMYDYSKGSQTLIRATEGTVLDRLPPRIKIRENASIELPHIMVLIDDPSKTVIEPIAEKYESLQKLYDFDLMMDGMHIKGYKVSDEGSITSIISALENLASTETFKSKYNVAEDKGLLLFAVGDGNHSLASAKSFWELTKKSLLDSEMVNHPARFALIELVNVHDAGLSFEPIHRVVFNIDVEKLLEHSKAICASNDMHLYYKFYENKNLADKEAVHAKDKNKHVIPFIAAQGHGIIVISNPKANLVVGTLQWLLDQYLVINNKMKIDYIHGEDVIYQLGSKPENIGFILPAMDKEDLFKTVIIDGVLPRKTFSMGEAEEKRFYLECRKIK